jgi:hypothetical protein
VGLIFLNDFLAGTQRLRTLSCSRREVPTKPQTTMAVLEHEDLAEPLLPRSEPDACCGDQPPSPDGSEAEEGAPTNDSYPATDENVYENEALGRDNNEENANPLSLPPNPYKNPNVILSFILCIVCGIADSIWGSVILSAFLLAYVMLLLAARQCLAIAKRPLLTRVCC